MFNKNIKNSAGKFSVKIDGNKEIIVDTYFEEGWGEYVETILLCEGNEECNHTIEIKIISENKDKDKDKETEVSIYGFLVS